MGDFVKGTLTDQYSELITKGIRRHRKIDVYSDSHPIPLKSRNRFSGEQRRFAGIIVDVCYDHFLSQHWDRYSDKERSDFIDDVYRTLSAHRSILPDRLQGILPLMIEQDWLGSYYSLTGVEAALSGISRRCKRINPLGTSITEIEQNYHGLESDFLDFFPQLIGFVKPPGNPLE